MRRSYRTREVSDGVIAPNYTPEALEILKNKRKGTYNVIKIDPAYRPVPIEHKDVFGITFEQGRNEIKLDESLLTHIPTKVMNLPGVEKIRRADRDNTIDVYISDDHEDVLADGIWQQFFTKKPKVLTREEKRAWLDTMKGVSLGSDAFFPFGDNIERAHKSGVAYIAQTGGSVRDDHVIDTCDKYGITMAFTGIRLFHH